MAEFLLHNRFQPVKGPFEPWYVTVTEAATNRVLEATYECPHCGMSFHTRKSCEIHCKGKPPNIPATCPALKKQRELF